MSTGITNIQNMEPELPLQLAEDLLSTPQNNLIYSFGADLHYADAHVGKTTRLSRYERLSTEGGRLDGSGRDPAPEAINRTDIDATMEIYAKTVAVEEQVTLYSNDKVLTKFTALLGQYEIPAVDKPLVMDLEGRRADRAQAGQFACAA